MVQLQRRRLIIGASVLLAGPLAALAQPVRRFRVGLLYGSSRDGVASEMASFLVRLEEMGYVQGKNLEIVARFADGVPARMPELAREVLEQNVEVVFVPNTQGALELQRLSERVPIIFLSGDPVKAGLVVSLAHPGRNATGFTQGALTIAAKRVELLKDAFPSITKLGILLDRNSPVQEELALVSEAARSFALRFRSPRRAAASNISRRLRACAGRVLPRTMSCIRALPSRSGASLPPQFAKHGFQRSMPRPVSPTTEA